MPETADIAINATSIGLFPHVDARLDLDVETLRPGMVVADIIPNPPRTRLGWMLRHNRSSNEHSASATAPTSRRLSAAA